LRLPAFTELGLALFLLVGLIGVVEDVGLEALAGAAERAVEVEVDAIEFDDRILGVKGGAEIGGLSDDGDRLPIWTQCWRISLKLTQLIAVFVPEFGAAIRFPCGKAGLVY